MSRQPSLDLFVAETVPPERGWKAPTSAPYAKGSETSKAGAKAVEAKLSRQCQELLDLYLEHGPLTDWEAKKLLGWERTTVNARRNGLGKRITTFGTRVNPDSGIANEVYGLAYGWAARRDESG